MTSMWRQEAMMVLSGASGLAYTLSLKWSHARVKSSMQLVETSVARAAPVTSSRGKPNRPNMKIGSRIRFRMAAPVITLLSSNVLPRARIEASEVHKAISSGATQYQTPM